MLQGGFLDDMAKRVESGLSGPRLPGVCLAVVGDRLTLLERRPLGTAMRDAGRVASLYRDPLPRVSSPALASMLLGGRTAPSNAAFLVGQILLVPEAVIPLKRLDREEAVPLRHFEYFAQAETAVVLGIPEEAEAQRYLRAFKEIKATLAAMRGGLQGP